MKTKTLIIELQYPATVSRQEIKYYAQSALQMWGGQRHPEDHLFYKTKAPKNKMRVVATPKIRCRNCGGAL